MKLRNVQRLHKWVHRFFSAWQWLSNLFRRKTPNEKAEQKAHLRGTPGSRYVPPPQASQTASRIKARSPRVRRGKSANKGENPVKQAIVLAVVMVLAVGIALAQMPTPTGLRWDANSELDLAGYYVYEATTSNGQVLAAFSYPPVLAPEHALLFITPHVDGQYYWKVTAYDTAGNESGFSEEVTADFNVTPPDDPVGCSVTY